MTEQVKALFDAARLLTEQERKELAAMLLGSLRPDEKLDRELADGARRRWAKHKASGKQSLDAFATLDEVRTKIRQNRP